LLSVWRREKDSIGRTNKKAMIENKGEQGGVRQGPVLKNRTWKTLRIGGRKESLVRTEKSTNVKDRDRRAKGVGSISFFQTTKGLRKRTSSGTAFF